MKSLKNIS